MNEKKLTDEEIVKALDICYGVPCCTSECPYFNKNGRNFCVEDNSFYKDMKRIVQEHSEQKAEIERLTEEKWQVQDDLDNYHILLREKEKQVDKLKAKNEHLDSENTRLICEMDKMLDDGWDIMDEEADGWYKKGVKDTAKEMTRLVEFHSVATVDENGIEQFSISALGLKEILHENFGIEYDELYDKGVEVE